MVCVWIVLESRSASASIEVIENYRGTPEEVQEGEETRGRSVRPTGWLLPTETFRELARQRERVRLYRQFPVDLDWGLPQ